MINGDDLRSMRLRAGISQDKMSKKLNCDRKTISNYELGVSDIRSKELFKWLLCCKINIDSLLSQVRGLNDDVSGSKKSILQDEE